MKISKSKQELARIISENGGWRDGAGWAAQDKNHAGKINKVVFYCGIKPWIDAGDNYWGGNNTHDEFIISDILIKNWHQTILSRDEYFHLHPVPDADGWIELNDQNKPIIGTIVDVIYGDGRKEDGVLAGGYSFTYTGELGVKAYRLHKSDQSTVESRLADAVDIVKSAAPALMRDEMKFTGDKVVGERKPTIEQLAADYRSAKDYAERKQQEADDAKADADEKLRVLEIAGEAHGLLVTPITTKQEPELVITDWRDLQERDVIWFCGDNELCEGEYSVLEVGGRDYGGQRAVRIDTIGNDYWIDVSDDWKLILRP